MQKIDNLDLDVLHKAENLATDTMKYFKKTVDTFEG